MPKALPARGKRASENKLAEYERFIELDSAPLGETERARVCRVSDPTESQFGGIVAVKLLTDVSDDGRARFAREIEVGRTIHHPNVMPVLQYSEDEGWFTMPVAGTTLARSRPKNDDDLVNMMMDVCAGLLAAHQSGFIHRDLKPSNVLRIGGRWVVGDWGLV